MWVYGPSPAGWRRTLRAVLPLPVGAPQASEKDLTRLDNRLGEIRRAPADAALPVPDPVVQLINLGRASRRQGILGGLRRGLAWANVVNPAQYLFRTYLSRRKDRRERYQGVAGTIPTGPVPTGPLPDAERYHHESQHQIRVEGEQ